jgi:hypothetical protein
MKAPIRERGITLALRFGVGEEGSGGRNTRFPLLHHLFAQLGQLCFRFCRAFALSDSR